MFDDVGISPGEITSETGSLVADSLRKPDKDLAFNNFLDGVVPFLDYRRYDDWAAWTLEVPLTPQLLLYKGLMLVNIIVEYVLNEGFFLYEPKKWVFELRKRDVDHVTGDVIPTRSQVHAEQQAGPNIYKRIVATLSGVVQLGAIGSVLYYRTILAAQRECNGRVRAYFTFNSDKGLVRRQAVEWLDGELTQLFTVDRTDEGAPPGWEAL